MTTTTTAAAAPRIQYFPTGTAGTGTQQLAYEPTDSQAPTKHQSTKPAHPAAGENGAALHSSTQHHTTQKRWTRRKQRMHKAACSPTQLIRPSRASTSNQANDTRQPPESNLFNPLEMTVPGNRDHGQVGNLCSLTTHLVLFVITLKILQVSTTSSTIPQTQLCQECLPLQTPIMFHVSLASRREVESSRLRRHFSTIKAKPHAGTSKTTYTHQSTPFLRYNRHRIVNIHRTISSITSRQAPNLIPRSEHLLCLRSTETI